MVTVDFAPTTKKQAKALALAINGLQRMRVWNDAVVITNVVYNRSRQVWNAHYIIGDIRPYSKFPVYGV